MGYAKIPTTAGYTYWTAESLAALADNARAAIGQTSEETTVAGDSNIQL
ncbi:hypothetical protein [Bifidobacterium aquikefiricola]|uniref:Uncharacterized protein n=1 Tax=Bifidobacterium aquikefiricola TaxID=3059038 RepID=A0AB39U5X1_9BIFI